MFNIAIGSYQFNILEETKSSLDRVRPNEQIKSQYEPMLWRSICSEYDAIKFYENIKTSKIRH